MKCGYLVCLEARVSRHERQAFDLRLRDQHPIKGIAVVKRQRPGRHSVLHADRQWREPQFAKPFRQVMGCVEFPGLALDLDFPR